MSSRSLTEAESRYSNIERLAVTYGLRFEYYMLGRNVTVETEQIFKKNIHEAPSRLQRLLVRCLPFDVHAQYKQLKEIHFRT